jgi:RNA polymerase sigma-70 factor (ECF subfamily)
LHSKLLQKTRDGDRRAAEALVRSVSPKIFALAYRMFKNQADAEEVVQEALLKLWKVIPEWEFGKAKVETWLYRITYNLCIDKLRASKKYIAEEIDDTHAADNISAEKTMIISQSVSQLGASIENLPSRQKSAIVLTYYEGLSAKEASAIMDTSVEAIESLLARAKRKLKEELNQQELSDGLVN